MNSIWANIPEFWRLIITWVFICITLYILLIELSNYWIKFQRKIRKTVIETSIKFNASEIEIIKQIILPKLFKDDDDLLEYLINPDIENNKVNFKISDESMIKLLGKESFDNFSNMKITTETIASVLKEIFSTSKKNESN